VLELATEIAGPYCGKLLADGGAEVIKVEPPDGDPLRSWRSGALFQYLNAAKRAAPVVEVTGVLASCDVVVVDGHAPAAPRAGQVVVSISPFGLEGPWADRPATEFTLQAWCGSIASRGTPERPPLYAAGRLGEWVGGTWAAVAALTALRGGAVHETGEHVDLSLLECMTLSLNTYAPLAAAFLGRPYAPTPSRTIEIPSVEPTADGFVGFCTITPKQWADFLIMIERPDWVGDADLAFWIGRWRRREEVWAAIRAWTTARTTAEVIAAAEGMRIPVTPIGDGLSLTTEPHFIARRAFTQNPAGFSEPASPIRIHDPMDSFREAERSPGVTLAPQNGAGLPLRGLRVLDFTGFWAGPAATHALACLGADVVKVEGLRRPDGMRVGALKGHDVDSYWEWSPIFHGVNTNKRAITLDLDQPDGIALARRLAAIADVVIENFTPRVMDAFGLGWDTLSALNPRLVMVRMPAFGLDGPWRDRPGFAQTVEQTSGLASVTGYADGPPVNPRGFCDPLGGMHAVVGLLTALRQRDADGMGRLVEVSLVEAAIAAGAEPVVEQSATGKRVSRAGNASWGASPQGVFACAGEDQWAAVSAVSDDQRKALFALTGAESDVELAAWCVNREVATVVADLLEAGVPAAEVVLPDRAWDNAQLRARRFLEPVDHPVVGRHDMSSVPFRLASRGTAAWLRRPAPTLGQHNREVLRGELDLDDAELDRLESDGVIGTRPAGAG
jgi:crotonobetainyl-CoA:carnitine CoA-transferase CaiB-like acyl-CoA transferase